MIEYSRLHNEDKYCKNNECTACTRGVCMTDFVYYTAPLENAISVFKSGSLLAAVNGGKQPDAYLHYEMFSWGNCQAGDRLVMQRKLKRSPTHEEMGVGFTPGVRFYFRCEDLEKHPQKVHDGFLPIKVKGEVKLADYVHIIIVPSEYKAQLIRVIPENLVDRTFCLSHENLDVWQWSEKAYSFVKKWNIV